MDMKKIVMAATLLSIVTGGEVSALAAKTTHQSVAKITHVKVTKHKVTGYTTAKSHIKLMKLKHGEKASATANKKGKFTVKVKSNNLTKLKFKIKATKPGLKARTYTHKVKKAVQAIDNSVTTETPASTTPVKPDEGKKPEKDKEKPQSKPSVNVVYKNVPGKPTVNSTAELITKIGTDLKKAKSDFDGAITIKDAQGNVKEITSDDLTFLKEVLEAKYIMMHESNHSSQAYTDASSYVTLTAKHDSKYSKISSLVDNSDISKVNHLIQVAHDLKTVQDNWNKISAAFSTASQTINPS
ncbi:hypothetical protein [Levilactobacillus suantsaiihabitans]|uniref:Bacterial Ig domain-containing protein n=1 Tax=Levilactobacillus suantsaiihabitans TaxID=2487722 RepID=A0A4Z0JA87_9LACO|nr:hypothetical protein [Levilactobacillus suantsaiihabitans]TGD17999.1 hypothetical protein EGT51_09970 [Levilactobacillus suantsaiihabitans]